jgi:hypothetical protein
MELKTLGLSFLVAVATLVAMYVTTLAWFTGAGIIFPSIVAWVASSLFAFERRPRHLWLHVAALGILVGTLINVYPFVVQRMFPPPPGYLRGGPNMNPPPGLTPIPPP